MSLGIIAGTNLFESRLFERCKRKKVKTRYGRVDMFFKDNIVLILRHGYNNGIPAHRIDHNANLTALHKAGVHSIISVTSVGSLKIKYKPTDIMVPSDFIGIWNIPTFYDSKPVYVTPELDDSLRKKIIEAARKAKIKVITKGTYVQTPGPRLETIAEVKMLSHFGDVVGMTMASEATLANELNLRYANISSIDNYANGISNKKLDFDQIKINAKKNSFRIESILKKIMGA